MHKHTTNTLTLNYSKDGDWFVGQLAEVPAVISQGKSLDELQENIRDAHQLMVEYFKGDATTATTHTTVYPHSLSIPIEIPVFA